MTIEEKQEILVGIYRKALGLGVVKTVKEFAEALEMNVSTISSALNGSPKHLTESLTKRARFVSLFHSFIQEMKSFSRIPFYVIQLHHFRGSTEMVSGQLSGKNYERGKPPGPSRSTFNTRAL